MDGTWLHVGDVAREQVGQTDPRGAIACRDRGIRKTQPGWLCLHSVKHSPSPYSVSDAVCNNDQEIKSRTVVKGFLCERSLSALLQ